MRGMIVIVSIPFTVIVGPLVAGRPPRARPSTSFVTSDPTQGDGTIPRMRSVADLEKTRMFVASK